jgi:hypothetical protein
MIKLLYTISVSALVCAGILLVFCGRLWFQDVPSSRSHAETSIAEKFQTLGDQAAQKGGDIASPLVDQATAYALYLDPPVPPAPKGGPQPKTNTQPAYVPPDTTAKFRLLATSYYRSSPEKSWALVSEPGKGDHWITKNERVGHFIVERVDKGAIFYRDGNQVREMKVTAMGTVQVAQIQSKLLSTSTQTIKSDLRLLNAPQPSSVE